MRDLDAREEWLAGLAADYASAAREARVAAVDYDDPYDDADPEDDDHAATVWPPTAETGLHLVRTPAAPAGVYGDRGDEDLAGAARPADRHDDGLPVHGDYDDDYDLDPEPACLIHDVRGEDVRGWEMAECTCTKGARP